LFVAIHQLAFSLFVICIYRELQIPFLLTFLVYDNNDLLGGDPSP